MLYMISPMKNPANVVAAIGLALGGVFGLLGTIVTESNLRAASWGIDSVGLVVATALLSLKYFRNGNDIVAAGFLVFAIGEGVMLSGTATTLEGSVPSFAAGTALWAAALLLTSVPAAFAGWVRLAGIIGAILLPSRLREYFGVNRCCQSPPRCRSSPIPSSSLRSSAGFGRY